MGAARMVVGYLGTLQPLYRGLCLSSYSLRFEVLKRIRLRTLIYSPLRSLLARVIVLSVPFLLSPSPLPSVPLRTGKAPDL